VAVSARGSELADATDPRIVRKGLAVLGMSIRERPRAFSVAVGGSVLYAAATVAQSQVIAVVTDGVIVPAYQSGATTPGNLAFAALVIMSVAVAKVLGVLGRRIGGYYMQRRQEANYRLRVVRQYTRLPISWHRHHPTGELLANSDADIRSAFTPIAPLPLSVGVIVLLIIAAVTLMLIDPWLALVAVCAAPAISIVNWRFNASMREPATRGQQRRSDVSAVAHESFEGALVVKTLGREASETERFRRESEALRDDLVEVGRVRARFDPLLEALPNVVILVLLLVGAVRLGAGAVTAGEIVGVTYLFTLLTLPLRVIGFLLGDLPRSVVGWGRVARVLGATNDLTSGDTSLAGSGPADVEARRVSFAHADDEVLSDVSFTVGPGRTVALVGPTGAGKSTLASLLVRLADPTGGAVALDGTELTDVRPEELPAHTAMVFQHTFLFDDTVRENLTLGHDYTDEEIRRAADLAQFTPVVEGLPDGWDTRIGEGGTSLSGGQRQRLALARALVRRPRLLILDDATSSVDPAVEAAILTGLREAELPSTVVVVAYRRATIALADEVIVLDGGRVVGHGTHAELLADLPLYRRLMTAYDRPDAA
jgi:ATP-binding cassette, subfamily B, bacterial